MSINLGSIIFDAVNDNKLLYLGTLLTTAGVCGMQLVFPNMYGDFIANIPDNTTDFDYKVILLALSPYIVAEILFYISESISAHSLPRVELSLLEKITSQVLDSVKSSKKIVDSNELIYNIRSVFDIKNMYHITLSYILPVLVISIGVSGMMMYADRTIGIATIILIVASLIALVRMSDDCANVTHQTENKIADYCGDIDDVFGNIDHVVAAGAGEFEKKKLKGITNDLRDDVTNKLKCNIRLKHIFSSTWLVYMVVLNGFALKLYYDKKITKSLLIAIFFMVLSFTVLCDSLLYEIHNIIKCLGEYKKTSEYFEKYQFANKKLKNKLVVTDGDIVFQDITLKFKDTVIFKNFDLNISGGSKVGIIGEIGSGKTSLLRMIMDIIPYDGDIYIDNQSVKEFEHDAIIKNIAYIPQNPKLFNRTILENLTYGTDKTLKDVQNE